jgi:hypothetical protein
MHSGSAFAEIASFFAMTPGENNDAGIKRPMK